MFDRILELLKEKNLTPSQFADEIGIQRSGMSHLISGRNKPSLEFVMKVLHRFPDVKPGWLLYGTEEPVNEPVDDRVITPTAPATLFDEPDIPDGKQVNKQPRIIKKEKTDRRIERIMIFYDDRSFREYEPERWSGAFNNGEEEICFTIGAFITVRSMYSIFTQVFTIEIAYGSFFCLGRVGCPNKFPEGFHGIFLFQNSGNNRSGGHKGR